jgi:hypothetical protein
LITQDQANIIAQRSANGEGVNAIIESLGLDLHTTLLDLQKHHRNLIKDAKQTQRNNLETNN